MNQTSSSNFILHESSDQFYWEGKGQLSIKTFRNGMAHYKTNKGFFAVEEDRYLLLNEGAYTISIEENKFVESFCIFFRDGLAEEVARSHETNVTKLLDDPFKKVVSIGFFEKTYTVHPVLASQLDYLKQNYHSLKADSLWLDEQFHSIMHTLLHIHFDTLKETELISSQRQSTREELYRRLHLAYDYIQACYNRKISLQEIANVACLSPNHLLRNYTQLFGKTPHEEITDLRITKAKKLLKQLNHSMSDIAFEIGYHTPASFSKLFKQKVGCSPLQFRKKVILDKI